MTESPNKITGFTPGRIQNWIRLVFACVAISCTLPLHAVTFSVSIDHDTILLGDTATLSLKFDDGQPGGTPKLPSIPGLQISYIGPSSAISFVNGRTSSSVTHNYVVKPMRTGDFTIPALSVKLGTETLTSEPVKFKVVRPAAPEPGSEAEQQSFALLRLSLPKKEVYAGETFVLEMQLLIRDGVQRISGTDLPGLQRPIQLDGCTVGKAVQGEQRRTVIGSTAFTKVPIYIPVTAMKTGKLNLGPLDGAVVVELPGRGGGGDLFEQFGFGGMFNRGPQQRVAVSAPAQTLDVLPLPEKGKPATFTGAVGSFEMAVSSGPNNVAVGDPITIHVEIKGRGSFDSFTLPGQTAWKEFKTYPPTAKVETTDKLGLEGVKIFEQVVVPQNTEIKELPAFEFSYFDPEKGGYRTLHQAAKPIIVRPSGSTPAPTVAVAGTSVQNQPSVQDIVHIKPRLGHVINSITPWIEQPWFLSLQALPLVALMGAIFWRKRTDSLANNPRLRRQKQVAQLVQDGLRQLQSFAAAGDASQFFATVFHLIQEQIGERLDLPASAITEAIVDEKLNQHGFSESGADVLHELFQLCNQARYAPVESAQKLEAVIPKLKMVLHELQEVKS